MLIPWMLYVMALSAIIAGAALALDKVAEIWGMRRRAVWMAAIMGTIALPLIAAVAPRNVATTVSPRASSASAAVERRSFRVVSPAVVPPLLQRLRTRLVVIASSPSVNRRAAELWAGLSLVAFSAFFVGAIGLRRRQSRWAVTAIDRHDVMISDDVGPAVVGTLRPRIVLPSWALSLNASERELMLRHEAEHIHGRDPQWLACAAFVVAALPWNPFVWLLARRLRLALEIDCDARVLAHDARTRDYGMLLLAVGARSQPALYFSASLVEPRSFLERRIVAMTAHRTTRPFAASLPFAAIAAFAVAAAAQTPRPARAPTSPKATVVTPAPAAAPVIASVTGEPTATTAPTAAPVAVAAPSAGVTTPTIATMAPTTAITTPYAPTVWPVPLDSIRAWTLEYHPNVIAGDASVNEVVIVVDPNEHYLRSYARFDSVADAPAGYVRRGRGSAMVGDSIHFKVLESQLQKPLYIVDGVVVPEVGSMPADSIRKVEVIKGPAAAAQYGTAAVNGVIVIDTKSETMLSRMNLSPSEIHQIDVVKVGAGVIAPTPLRVVVVQVK